MARVRSIVTTGFVTLVSVSSGAEQGWSAPNPSRGQGTTPTTLVVHVDNRAGVPANDLARARAEVARVFEAAGIDLEWIEESLTVAVSRFNRGGGDRYHVGTLLIRDAAGAAARSPRCVLGAAVPSIATSYVYVDRIALQADRHPVDGPVVLGRIIAHEIGHLLLPADSHARRGIMRADLDLGYTNPPRFTRDESRQLQARLEFSLAAAQ